MKDKSEIYKEYIELGGGPWFFGKEEHWRNYYEGYEMGYSAVAEDSLNSIIKELGIDLKNFPTNVDEQFGVMKKALQKYYEDRK